jgi:hypothetical protein
MSSGASYRPETALAGVPMNALEIGWFLAVLRGGVQAKAESNPQEPACFQGIR